MKQLCYLLVVGMLLASCKKDDRIVVSGTVVMKAGYYPNSYLVAIDNPDAGKHNFICTGPFSGGLAYSCVNAVFFINIPAALAVPGTRIRFSKWSDKGPNLVSSFSGVAHDVEIYDAAPY